jgi:hypothetical protein
MAIALALALARTQCDQLLLVLDVLTADDRLLANA